MTRKHYIYCYRSGCGSRRQPTQARDLRRLELALRDNLNGKGHPYHLNYHEKRELLEALLEGLAGTRRAAVLPESEYLYRVCTIEDFIYNTQLPLSDSERADPASVWENLRNMSAGQWLPLPESGGKKYTGCGQISWWTDLPLPVDVVVGALKIGMCTNWLVPRSILMRCKVSFIQAARLAYVPTILDAFCQLVFHPRYESNNPPCGKAIDLSQSGPLSTGASEFVLRPVDCGQIEFFPISISSDMKKSYKRRSDFHPELLNRLIAYYKII